MLRWLQTKKFAITADKLPTRYLGIDIQRTELAAQGEADQRLTTRLSLTLNVHWHALLELIVFSKESTPMPTKVPGNLSSAETGCRTHPERCYKLQAEAIRGCNLDHIARLL